MPYWRSLGLTRAWLILAALLAGGGAPMETAMADGGPPEAVFLDWAGMVPRDSPNGWLVAPDGAAPDGAAYGQGDETAPVFPVPAPVLARAWQAVVAAQPRGRILAVSEDGLRIEAEQRSAVFGFVDRISVEVVALASQSSTLAVYSRATVGYWDFGVNRRRLRDWLAALAARVAPVD